MDMIYFYSSKYIPPWSVYLFACSFNFFMLSRKEVFEMLLSFLVTAHWISSTVRKCRPFKENLTWGRESSWQVQDLASKVGGGEQQHSCSPETSSQLQHGAVLWLREEQISRRSLFFPSLRLQFSEMSPYQYSNDQQSFESGTTVFFQQTTNRSTFSSVLAVEGWPLLASSFTSSLPSRKRAYHRYTIARLMA